MGTHSTERWVLAFDASCGRRQLAGVVRETCGDRLEVLALTNTDVERWREQALGAYAPWAPTLLQVRGDGVGDSTARAWIARALPCRCYAGSASARPYACPAPSVSCGWCGARPANPGPPLRPASDGCASSSSEPVSWPAGCSSPAGTPRRRANRRTTRRRAPGCANREAVYTELPPAVRSRLWTEHLDRFRAARAGLTAGQREVLITARAIVADQATFERGLDAELDRRLLAVGESAISTFGKGRARDLLATLGPPEQASPRADDCTCAALHRLRLSGGSTVVRRGYLLG